MNRRHKTFLGLLGAFIFSLTISESFSLYKTEPSAKTMDIFLGGEVTHTATFYDYNGTTVLEQKEVREGSVPVYAGSKTPYRTSTASLVYYHQSWNDNNNVPIGAITKDTSYYPTFASTAAVTLSLKPNEFGASGQYYSIWYTSPSGTRYSNSIVHNASDIYDYAFYVPSNATNVEYVVTSSVVSGQQTKGTTVRTVNAGGYTTEHDKIYVINSNKTSGYWGRYVYMNYKNVSWWGNDNAKFGVYYFGSGDGFSDIMIHEKGTQYYTTIPVGYPHIIFLRLNSSATAVNWGNVWNQTVDVEDVAWQNYNKNYTGYISSAEDGGKNKVDQGTKDQV